MSRRALFIKYLFRFLLRAAFRVEIQNLHNIPAKGPYIIAVNHLTLLEPPLVFALLPIPKMTAFVADKWRDNKALGWIVRWADCIFVNREQIDRRALKEALAYLKEGGALGIAPEGTRSKTGGLIPAKTGIAYLADKAKAPILPVGISGQLGWADSLKRFKRPHIRIHIGQPLHLPPLTRGDKNQQLKDSTDRIMVALAQIIDPDLRGVYTELAEKIEPYQ